MGHSDIGVTLNTYTHLGYEDAKDELQRLVKAGKGWVVKSQYDPEFTTFRTTFAGKSMRF